MHTKESLMRDILLLGIRPDEVITVHTSLRSVGKIDTSVMSGAHVLIDALRSCVPQGLLVIPSHTFLNIREDGPFFDIRRTMPCIGTVPTVAVDLANRAHDEGDETCIRSMHFSHSVVAFGSRAREFTECDRSSHTRAPMSGCYGQIYRENGRILLIGVDMSRNTFIHAVDEETYPTIYGTNMLTVTDYDGTSYQHEEKLTKGPTSSTFVRFTDEIECRGGIVRGKIGDADAMLVDSRICYDVVAEDTRN